MLASSGFLPELQRVSNSPVTDLPPCVYGDSAYPIGAQLQTMLEISACLRQLKLRSGNQILGKIKGRLPEKNSPDNPGKNRSTYITVMSNRIKNRSYKLKTRK